MSTAFFDQLAQRLDVPPQEAEDAYQALLDRLYRDVADRGAASVPGLGTFKQHEGTLVFQPAEALADAVNFRFGGLDVLEVGGGPAGYKKEELVAADELDDDAATPDAADESDTAEEAEPSADAAAPDDERTQDVAPKPDDEPASEEVLPAADPFMTLDAPEPEPVHEVAAPEQPEPEPPAAVPDPPERHEPQEIDRPVVPPPVPAVPDDPVSEETVSEETVPEETEPEGTEPEETEPAEPRAEPAEPMETSFDARVEAAIAAGGADLDEPEALRAPDRPAHAPAPPDADQPERRSVLLWVFLGIVVIVGAGVVWALLSRTGPSAPDEPAVAVQQTPLPAPSAEADTTGTVADTLAGVLPADTAATAEVPAAEPEPSAEADAPADEGGFDRSRGGYTLIVASAVSESDAAAMADRFEGLDLPLDIVSGRSGNVTRYRVGLGQFADRAAAEAARADLAGRIPDDAWILAIPRN